MSVQPPKTYYKPKNKRQEKIILPIILCKNNYSLPQVGNDQTIFLQKLTCKENLEGLQYRNALWKYSCQYVQIKITHQDQSTGKHTNETIGAGAAPSSTYGLPLRISLWGLLSGRLKYWPWRWDYLNMRQMSQYKEHQWRRKKLSGGRWGWGGA